MAKCKLSRLDTWLDLVVTYIIRHIRAKSPLAKDKGQRHYWHYLVEHGYNDVHDEDEIFSFAHDLAVLYVDEEAS